VAGVRRACVGWRYFRMLPSPSTCRRVARCRLTVLMVRAALAALLCLTLACGRDRSTPTSPTTTSSLTITGTITSTTTGQPIGQFTHTAASLPAQVTVGAPGFVTRETWITSVEPQVDLFPEDGFDLGFYREFVRNSLVSPGALEPLRRHTSSLQVYVRTIDDAGTPVAASTLTTIDRSITPALIEAWSGGRLTLLSREHGEETREGMPGWVTVKWASSLINGESCGRAVVGGGWMELSRSASRCGCPGTGETYPRLVRHEMGHVMGFHHTSGSTDVMSGSSSAGCDTTSSLRERHHAALAYARPRGNTDVDSDPRTPSAFSTHPIVVD